VDGGTSTLEKMLWRVHAHYIFKLSAHTVNLDSTKAAGQKAEEPDAEMLANIKKTCVCREIGDVQLETAEVHLPTSQRSAPQKPQ
jgi:hypothetical protein